MKKRSANDLHSVSQSFVSQSFVSQSLDSRHLDSENAGQGMKHGGMRNSGMKHHVLLTGVTGFVGKVVLWQLLDQREELGIGHISVLVRCKGGSKGKKPVGSVQSAV
ncbi:MAG: hypothetical protein RL685_2961, partial [Pseudomonadota bacterium]